MSKKNQAMCPLFTDMPCPQGQGNADACKVRMHGDFNPLSHFKDYLFMNCALQQAKVNERKNQKPAKS